MTDPADTDDIGMVEQSKHAWPEFGTERAVWIPCPAGFPEGDDRYSWARRYATAWWSKSGAEYGDDEVAGLAKILTEMRELIYRPGQCHLAVIHLPPAQLEPRRVLEPVPVGIGVWQLRGEREARLRLLTNADNQNAVEPPLVEEFGNDELGTGLKTLRYGRLPDGALFAAANYAFRSEEYETDLRFDSSCPDLAQLQAALPDIDELVRTTGLRAWNRD
ncbi:MAG: hypothetical protein J2P35_18680 [Actinobacteria bacterium]|nr:hypothetical protein [Actinomycetota bacterium]MBO0788232.1 hypothetical protein [Actinomycetota bacterium]